MDPPFHSELISNGVTPVVTLALSLLAKDRAGQPPLQLKPARSYVASFDTANEFSLKSI